MRVGAAAAALCLLQLAAPVRGQTACAALSPTPAHSSGCNGPLADGAKCMAVCDSGYTAPKAQQQFTCANGTYAPAASSLTCTVVSCRGSPTPAHSRGNCGATKNLGQACTMTCDGDHTIPGEKTTQRFTCVADGVKATGKWTGSLTCSAERCPTEVSPGVPYIAPAGTTCRVVRFVGYVKQPRTDVSEEHQLWADGLRMYAAWINDQGGLRLAGNDVGYVNVTLLHLEPQEETDNGPWKEGYATLLEREDVQVLLAPIETEKAVQVLKQLHESTTLEGIPAKPILVSSSVPQMFKEAYPYTLAVDSPSSRAGAVSDIITTLNAAGAKSFTIAGEDTPRGNLTLGRMISVIKKLPGAELKFNELRRSNPMSSDPLSIHAVSEDFSNALEGKPDAFMAIAGFNNGFTAALDFFEEQRYPPNAAVYVGGLATTPIMRKKQRTGKDKCQVDDPSSQHHCFVFDQWIGTVAWAKDMASPNHAAPDLRHIPDRYHNRIHADLSGSNRSRYIGSASDFAEVAPQYLTREPSQYLAGGAATLMMFQMAVELASADGTRMDGTGLSFDDLNTANGPMKAALTGLVVNSSFWGPIKMTASDTASGHWNQAFTMGIGQFQNYEDTPRLIGPESLLGESPATLIYPALWPCGLLPEHDSRRYAEDFMDQGDYCEEGYKKYTEDWHWVVGGIVGMVVLCAVIAGCCVYRGGRCKDLISGPVSLDRSVLRESLLGNTTSGKNLMPDAVLGERDVAARWTAVQLAHSKSEEQEDERRRSMFGGSAPRTSSANVAVAQAGRQHKANGGAPVFVFFHDTNVRELQPPVTPGKIDGWKHTSRQIGAGAYGVVFKAVWREKEVAVKLLKLPEEPKSAKTDDDTKEGFVDKLQEIVADYTKEVEICCDLAHPNLVSLLGYATKPDLLLMQELMEGSSIDNQLYKEKWKPTTAQTLKVALDVAKGMAYLHTAFQETRVGTKKQTRSGKAHTIDKPIVHRDLKSPNLLLRFPPPRRGQEGNAEDLVCKISDFGLSRDKNIEDGSQAGTALMTGCGSILWMAPEILLGDLYNEKVDVFSYAMCLLEIVSRSLPWHGLGVGQQVIPVRLTQGKRPDMQLKNSKAPKALKDLIEDCWKQDRYMRPEFPVIVTKVEELYKEECRKLVRDEVITKSRGSLGKSRSARPNRDMISEGDEDSDEVDDLEVRAPRRVMGDEYNSVMRVKHG